MCQEKKVRPCRAPEEFSFFVFDGFEAVLAKAEQGWSDRVAHFVLLIGCGCPRAVVLASGVVQVHSSLFDGIALLAQDGHGSSCRRGVVSQGRWGVH